MKSYKKVGAFLFIGFSFSNCVSAQVSIGVGAGLTYYPFDYVYEESHEVAPYRDFITEEYSNSAIDIQYVIPLTIHYANNFGLETGLSFNWVGYHIETTLEEYDIATDNLVGVYHYTGGAKFPVMSIPLFANYYFGSGKMNFILSSGIATNVNIFEGIDFSFAAGGVLKYNLNRIAFFADTKYWMDLTPSFEFMDDYPDPLHKKGIVAAAGVLFSFPGKKKQEKDE